MNQTEKNALSDKKLLELIIESQCNIFYISALVSGAKGVAQMDRESRRQAEYKRELIKRGAKRRKLVKGATENLDAIPRNNKHWRELNGIRAALDALESF